MSNLPRISYNSIFVEFDRGWNVFDFANDQIKVQNISAAGIRETLSYFDRDRLLIRRNVASANLQAQLEQFWAYARTGQTFLFWKDRDLAAYWDYEGKSYTSNDTVAGTLTRATTAYYDDPSTGLVTSVTTGTARFPTGKFGRGILLERAATNIILRSAELDNVAWTATTLTVTANSTESLDPAGGTTAEKCVPSAGTGTLRQDTTTNIGTDDATFSIYVRHGGEASQAGTLYVIRADTGATLQSQAITVTQVWQRFEVTYTSTGDITANWGVKIDFTGNSNIFYAWGAQLEVGQDIFYSSSYIPTTSASATRNIDVLSYTASSVLDDTYTRGTISFWYAPTFSSAANNLSRYLFSLQTTNASSPIDFYINTDETLVLSTAAIDSTAVTATSTAVTLTEGTFAHYVATWDTSVSNGLNIYFNGALVGTSSNSAFSINRRGTNIYIGNNGTAISCDGIIDDFLIRKDVMTAAQILAYYNSSRAWGVRRNYWSSMILPQDAYEPETLQGAWRFGIPFIFEEVLT